MNSASYWADQPASADWSLPEPVFTWLSHRIDKSTTVLELGSGAGTARLARMAGAVWSVEHDVSFMDQHGSQYIHAPIRDGWYDRATLAVNLPDAYDCIIVDGPPGRIASRLGFLHNLDLFLDVPILFDDVHRNEERELAIAVSSKRNQSISLHIQPDGRAFATVGWELP